MSKTVHRIIELISELNLSARQFDISIGTANGYILRMKKNNASVGSDVIERIKETYPQVNLVWLITGEGEMFIKTSSEKNTALEIESFIEQHLNESLTSDKRKILNDILKELD